MNEIKNIVLFVSKLLVVFFASNASAMSGIDNAITDAEKSANLTQAMELKQGFPETVAGIEMVFVRGGCFNMGDTVGDGKASDGRQKNTLGTLSLTRRAIRGRSTHLTGGTIGCPQNGCVSDIAAIDRGLPRILLAVSLLKATAVGVQFLQPFWSEPLPSDILVFRIMGAPKKA